MLQDNYYLQQDGRLN